MAVAASCGLAASCSLVTTWDGLTSDDAGPGSGGGVVADGSTNDAPPDVTPDAPPAFECTPKEHYCGGNGIKGSTSTLYLCKSDSTTAVLEVCAHGCLVLPAKDDICRCLAGGSYCGGDHIDGDPTTLYKCNADGSGTVLKHCVNGCVVMTGKDDACG